MSTMNYRWSAFLASIFVIPTFILAILVLLSGYQVKSIALATLTATGNSLSVLVAQAEGSYMTLTPWGYCLLSSNGVFTCNNVQFSQAFNFSAALDIPQQQIPVLGDYLTLIANLKASGYNANNPFVFTALFVGVIAWGLVLLAIVFGATCFKRVLGIGAFLAGVGTAAMICASVASYVTYSTMQKLFNQASNGAYTISTTNGTIMCVVASCLGALGGIILIRAGVLAYRRNLKDSQYYEN
ncbi:hypothetical protein SmJEL517_g02537 [Synchytrium microbalum]|uniref:Uncharacterized protein n=1 Tax=Synchytrium microbalum TaxID=1806994 RepID=A0A507C9Z8_9FUNG|nr:uncharacterized protein SmJEL517_g02537 [Synchytrium microbalum]TPX34816.1 hypothetical protein SmJEL517_g02537 [Synchytrium microbalum]